MPRLNINSTWGPPCVSDIYIYALHIEITPFQVLIDILRCNFFPDLKLASLFFLESFRDFFGGSSTPYEGEVIRESFERYIVLLGAGSAEILVYLKSQSGSSH
jgi:hypothetical protein